MTARRPVNLSHLTILAIVLLAGTVTLPQVVVNVGNISGLGVLTMAQCAAVWLLWLQRPALPASNKAVLPLLLFGVYALVSAFYNPPQTSGVQNMFVMLTFIGAVLLSAREVENFPSLVPRIARALEWAVLIGLGLYACDMADVMPEEALSPRGFALFALIGLANHLALWRYGHRRGLIMSIVIMVVIFESMSRLALVAGIVMFPLAVLIHGHRRALLRTIGVSALAAAALGAAIFLNERMYNRFFAEDATFEVGGTAINVTGRMQVWEAIYESFWNHPVLGQGAGSTGPYTNLPGMGHPHNDYLRQAHDYGAIGFGLWLWGMIALAVRASRSARRPYAQHDPLTLMHVAAALGMFSVFASMFTDNSVAYVFVMAPLGVLVGASLGLARRQAGEAGALDVSPAAPTFGVSRGTIVRTP